MPTPHLSMPMDQAFLSFSLNMGEFFENEAKREGREMTKRERDLYQKELFDARKVVVRSKFDTSKMTPEELVRAQDAERKARVIQLAQIAETIDWSLEGEDDEDGELADDTPDPRACLAQMIEAPAFI